MKKLFIKTLKLTLVCLLLASSSCEKDLYEEPIRKSKKSELTFEQFKKETDIKDFKILRSLAPNSESSRTIENEFLTDTLGIIKYTSVDNKVTYSFKIYPITELLDSKEYYNLVYEKYGEEWNEIIFKNTEKTEQIQGEPILEESKMVYNERFSSVNMAGFCQAVNYEVHCNGSCGSGPCDGFNCSTGECIQTSISYVYCGGIIGDNLDANPLHVSTGGAPISGGGTDYSGIYIPNPYDGEADLNNPDFVLATQVAAFTRTLSNTNPAIKNLLENNFWLFPNIVEFVRNNGGTMTQANTSAITFALINYNIFQQDLYFLNWQTPTINKFKLWALKKILNNPDNETVSLINELKELAMSEDVPEDNTLEFVMQAIDSDKIYNDLDENFLLSVDQYIDENVAEMASNVDIGTDQLIMHFTIQCAVLRANHPEWSDMKIYWEASKELVHITLDILGLVPVFGEVADLTNGILYTIEGEGLNATLSFAATVPVAGWAAVGVKYAFKVNEVATIGTKIKLVWKVTGDVITFGQRGQLRKVLNITSSTLQAHHLIPWSSRTKTVVQRAAKSGNAFHMNEALNGIAVASWRNQPNHQAYNNKIDDAIDNFLLDNPNATPNQCYNFLTNLIEDVRAWVINNPNSHLNDLVLP